MRGGRSCGGEIEVLVGDVEGEDAVGLEVAEVELDGLSGEQVQRDGVAGEGVDGEDVEVLRVVCCELGGERGAGVAGDDGDLGDGVADVGEEVAGDGLDLGVDLVEADAVVGAGRRRRGFRLRGR